MPLLLFASLSWGFDKDLRTVNDRVPLEFQHLFDSMKISLKTNSERLRFVGICKELDENLGQLQKEHIFFLLKSEVIKNILEYRHPKVRSFDVTTFLLDRLDQSYLRKQSLLTPFSRWIWLSIIAEMNHRKNLGLISAKSFNPGLFDGSKRIEADRFNRYLNYLLPWIDKMDSLDANEFNELTKKVSWIILNRLNERSILFRSFASTSAAETRVAIINIPSRLLELHPEDIKRMQSDEVPLTLKDKSEKEKTEASEQAQSLTPDDLSPLSDEVSKELDKKAP